MRVTEGSISSTYLFSVGKTRERMMLLQAQLAGGKKVTKASDDPQATDTILRLKESKKTKEQYQNNAIEGQGIAEITSTTLGQFADLLINVKVLVVKASHSADAADLVTYGEQVDQLLTEAVDVANTKFNGKYILGGTQTLVQPYTLAADKSSVTKNPNGIDGIIKFQVGDGIDTQVNVTGESALQGTQIFDLLISLRDSLKNGTFTSTAFLNNVDQSVSYVLDAVSLAASYAEHFENISQNIDEQVNQLLQYLSFTQDTDVAEAVMKLKHEEVMLDAALNTGARIIPKSLLDYLR